MTTMKAVRAHDYGGPEVLVYEDAPLPTLAAGEVLVKVAAAGINPIDWVTRQYGGVGGKNKTLPMIVGWDIAGVVEQVAPGVTAFQPGDAVFGMVNFPQMGNAYAEYVAAPVEHLAQQPANLTPVQAAALPLAALTAWQALFDTADLQAGQRLLIQAAAGGVGHLAVQLARWKGAHVIGTASSRNHDFLRGLGADEVIDYTATRFEDVISPVDVVLACVGGETLDRSLAVIRRGGKLVSITGQPDPNRAAAAGVEASSILVHTSHDQLAQIAELCQTGHLKVEVSATFPLAQAAQAQEMSASGRTRGKIVLVV